MKLKNESGNYKARESQNEGLGSFSATLFPLYTYPQVSAYIADIKRFLFWFFKFDNKGVKILIFLVMQLSTLAFTAGGKKGTVHCLLKYMPFKQ